MKSLIPNRLQILGIILLFGSNFSIAQNSRSYFYENEFDISIPLKEKWSMVVGVGNRGMLQERLNGDKISAYQHEHLELNHFTNYQVRQPLVLSLGLRYRFRELFDPSETNEFRIIEQVEIESLNSSLPISHRIRLEQRFREHTIHRLRYDIGVTKPISEAFSIGAGTEALYAVSARLKPEAEHRFSLSLENSSFENLELGLTVEYRMENYTRSLAHEVFVITGVTWSL